MGSLDLGAGGRAPLALGAPPAGPMELGILSGNCSQIPPYSWQEPLKGCWTSSRIPICLVSRAGQVLPDSSCFLDWGGKRKQQRKKSILEVLHLPDFEVALAEGLGCSVGA